jgi:hypothetical protein
VKSATKAAFAWRNRGPLLYATYSKSCCRSDIGLYAVRYAGLPDVLANRVTYSLNFAVEVEILAHGRVFDNAASATNLVGSRMRRGHDRRCFRIRQRERENVSIPCWGSIPRPRSESWRAAPTNVSGSKYASFHWHRAGLSYEMRGLPHDRQKLFYPSNLKRKKEHGGDGSAHLHSQCTVSKWQI